jgi:hypothetical protein
MFLYVDESEGDDYFVVTGLLFKNDKELKHLYKNIHKFIKNQKMSNKQKAVLLLELKDYDLHRGYKRIKKKILHELGNQDVYIYYSTYQKLKHFDQSKKERVYIKLLKDIVERVQNPINVIYDEFNLKRFHINIEYEISLLDNVVKIRSGNSQKEKLLQFADIICGTIRRFLQDDDREMYELIKDKIIDIISR